MKSEVHDRFYCYNCGGECFHIHDGLGKCKGFSHEEVGCGVTWKSPEEDWKFFGYSVHVGFESQEEYEASQKAEYFDPTFSFEEQRDAMRWAFLEAVRCCRSAKATEDACREVGLPVASDEDVAARLATLFSNWAARYGPKEEGEECAT
jgi:hypothetical protein